MKRTFLIIAIICLAIGAQAQFGITKGIKTIPENKIISNAEVGVIDSINTTMPIQRQLDKKVNTSGIVNYTNTLDPRYINEAGDTIAGVILAPTAAQGTDTQQLATMAAITNESDRLVRHVAESNERITHTGTVAETTLLTKTFPSSYLGLNGQILFRAIFDGSTGDGYTKNIYLKINGTTVATFSSVTSTLIYVNGWVACRNSTTSKVGAFGQPNLTVNADAPTFSIDTSTGTVTVTLTSVLSNTAAVAYIDQFSIETIY